MSNSYLLIDGVLWRQALPDLYRRSELLKIEPLYSGTRFAALQDLGPILVQVNTPSSLAREWLKSSELQSRSSLLSSRSSMKELSAHLRRFIQTPQSNGGTSLLRFSGPLVLYHWLSSYSPTALDQILGPVERMQVKTPTHAWQSPAEPPITRFNRQALPDPWQEDFAMLGEHQMQALLEVDRWMFEERLYGWLLECEPQMFSELDGDQISQWFAQVLDAGSAWGLFTEQALMTWVLICADWGADFATRAQSPYRNWIRQAPDHARLPAELRIEALDNYRQQNQTTKDTAHG